MSFPVELIRVKGVNGLALKVSTLNTFAVGPAIVPESKISKQGFFDITYEQHYTVQQIEFELEKRGINANAYRPIRTKDFTNPITYGKIHTTTFQSYKIPEELARKERKNFIELTSGHAS